MSQQYMHLPCRAMRIACSTPGVALMSWLAAVLLGLAGNETGKQQSEIRRDKTQGVSLRGKPTGTLGMTWCRCEPWLNSQKQQYKRSDRPCH